MRMRLTPLALLLLAAPLAAQVGAGMGMDKGKMDHGKMMMKDHVMPAVAFEGVAPHTATGTFTMSVKDGQHFVEINKDFKSTGAPDGFVYLTKDGKVDATALELGELAGGQGGGTFAVPTDTKVWEFNTVVIWSKAHHAVVGKAPLHGSMMKHGDGMMRHDTGMMKHDTGMMKKP